MSESIKYNNLSPKLRALLPKLKPGEKMRFQLNGIRHDKLTGRLICPNSFLLMSTDRIYDPWAHKIEPEKKGGKVEYEGDYVDIAYIMREVPAPKDSPKDSIVNFGTVKFIRTTAGVIEIIGGKRDREKMLIILFFNNRNSSNVDKPWYVKPEGKSVFHLVDKAETATKSLESELQQDQARDIIKEMNEEQIKQVASGLFPQVYNSLTNDERILRLRKIAAQSPLKIIELSLNKEVRTTAFIEECLRAELIALDTAKNQWIWFDDRTKICSIKPAQTPHHSMKRYFMTDEGVEVLSALEGQLAMTKKDKKEKTETAVV